MKFTFSVFIALCLASIVCVAMADEPQVQQQSHSETGVTDRWAPFKDLAAKLTGAMRKPHEDLSTGKSVATIGAFVFDAVLTLFSFAVELAVELVRAYSPSLGETLHTAIVKTDLFSRVAKLSTPQ